MSMSAPGRTRVRLEALILLGLTACAPWLTGTWAILRFPALCLLPGAAVAFLLAPRAWRDPSRWLAASLLGSAALTPASLFLALRALGDPDRALVAISIGWGALLAAVWLIRRAGLAERGGLSALARDGFKIALLTVVVAFPLLVNPELRVRSDAWTHIALVREILRGAWPWHDPRFAGQPLRYFWFFNLWAAGFSARGGLSFPWALVLVNCAALAAYTASLWALFRRFLAPGAMRVAAAVVVIGGLNPFGLLAVPLRLATGLVGANRGSAALAATAGELRFRGTAVMQTLTPYGTSFVAWIDKFLVVTAFGIGMAGAVFASMLVWEAIRTGHIRRESLALLALGYAALVLHHLVAAAFVGFLLGGALVLAGIIGRIQPRGGKTPPRGRGVLPWTDTAAILGVLLAILAVTGPYWLKIVRGGEVDRDDAYGIGIEALWIRTALVTIGPLLLLLWWGRRRLGHLLRGAAAAFAAFVALAALLILLVRMPTVNENKMIILFFCMAAPFGAPGALRVWRRLARSRPGRTAAWALAAAAGLVPLLLWTGELSEKSAPLSPEVAAACAWLREESPRRAVLIEPPGRKLLMNLAERDMLVSDYTFVLQCGYPHRAMGERLDLVRRLYATGEITPEDAELLDNLHRPVYAFYEGADPSGAGMGRIAAAGPGAGTGGAANGSGTGTVRPSSLSGFERVFHQGTTDIYEWRGTGAGIERVPDTDRAGMESRTKDRPGRGR